MEKSRIFNTKILIIILGALVGIFAVIFAFSGNAATTKSYTDEFDSSFYIDKNLTSAVVSDGKVTLPSTYVSGRVVSTRVYTSRYEIVSARLTVNDSQSAGSAIIYYISINDGRTWKRVEPGFFYDFDKQDGRLKWMAVLTRDVNGNTPSIEKITITYKEDSDILRNSNDSRRRNDLALIASGLNEYFKDFGRYPHVEGTNARQRWLQLQLILNKRSDVTGRFYVTSWPNDPLHSDPETPRSYDYRDINNSVHYVLAARLENAENGILRGDVEGVFSGVNCDDPVYCIGSSGITTGAATATGAVLSGTETGVSDTSGTSGIANDSASRGTGTHTASLAAAPTSATRTQTTPRQSTIPLDHPARISVANALSKIYNPLRDEVAQSTESQTTTTQTQNGTGTGSGVAASGTVFTGMNGSAGSVISRGHLVTVPGDPEVYEIINGQRHWIPNAAVFEDYGFRTADIHVIDRGEFNRHPRAYLLRVLGSSDIYYLTETGRIRRIPNMEISLSYGDRLDDVIDISSAEFNSYPHVKYIYLETKEDTRIWLLDGNTKYPVDPTVLPRLDVSWRDIAPVNRTEFDYYKDGREIRN